MSAVDSLDEKRLAMFSKTAFPIRSANTLAAWLAALLLAAPTLAIAGDGEVPTGAFGGTDSAVAEEPVSEAERLLWMSDQITAVPAGTLLRYRYDAHAIDEDPIQDEVDLEIIGVNEDGSRSASIYFFTGDRNRHVEPFERARGNPVLGVYLQEDVYQMGELTGGNWRYFHRKVKKALAHDATIEDIQVEFEGRQVAARRVTFVPFQYDERRDHFEDSAEKRYSIVVSDQVPGFLYEVHTLIPAREAGAPPLREARLRLSVVKATEGTPTAGSTAAPAAAATGQAD